METIKQFWAGKWHDLIYFLNVILMATWRTDMWKAKEETETSLETNMVIQVRENVSLD